MGPRPTRPRDLEPNRDLPSVSDHPVSEEVPGGDRSVEENGRGGEGLTRRGRTPKSCPAQTPTPRQTGQRPSS